MRLLRTTGLRTTSTLLCAAVAALAASGCTFLTGVHPVTRVAVTIAPNVISVGQTAQALGTAYDGSTVLTSTRYAISYSSRDAAIATVDPSRGLIIAYANGTTYIVGESNGKRDSATVTVRPVQARQVVIGTRAPMFRVGATNAIGATIFDSTNNALRDRAITWTARTPTVLTITNVGVVTPLAVGTTWVVASVDNGPGTSPVVDSVLATVTQPPVTNITITPSAPTLYTGQTLPFTATVTDSLLTTVTRRVVWSTGNATVLAIDSLSGLATPVTPSSFGTTVTATVDVVPGFPAFGKRTATVNVSVLAPTNSVRVQNSSGTTITAITVASGASTALVLVPLDAVGNPLATRTFRLTSSNPAVASVPATSSSSTQVMGVASGTSTLTIQALDASGAAQGTAATLTVTVP